LNASQSAQLAAHARSEGLVLVTNNMGEFSRVPALQTENWLTAPLPCSIDLFLI
jgi:predicted nucleic acid-binding protein